LVPGPGAGCVSVLRMECSSPGELVDMFLDITRGCSIPSGSVFLIGSLTHLADVGLGAYTDDVSKAAAKLGRIFQGGLVVLPGLIFPPGGVEDPVLYRQLIDVIKWSQSVAKLVENGVQIMDSCLEGLALLLMEAGTGGEQADHGARYRLPCFLGSSETVKWDTRGLAGLKNGASPLAPSQIIEILNKLFVDLSNAMGVKKIKVAGLHGASVLSKIGKLIVIVGASHTKRLAKQFNEAGETCKLVDTPNFRLVSRNVADLTAKLRTALQDRSEDDAVILFNNIDNCFFLARS
jgi:hypothetical protein